MAKDQLFKPKLRPLNVPWRIVSDTPYLRLRVSEVNNVEVLFVGQKVKNQNFLLTEHEIAVKFKNPIKTVTSSKWSDRYTVNPSSYDWSEINPDYLPHSSVSDLDTYEKTQKQFMDEWWASSICPVSNAYEVINPDVSLKQYKTRHYLFVGADLYFEVISQKMSWSENEQINWFN